MLPRFPRLADVFAIPFSVWPGNASATFAKTPTSYSPWVTSPHEIWRLPARIGVDLDGITQSTNWGRVALPSSVISRDVLALRPDSCGIRRPPIAVERGPLFERQSRVVIAHFLPHLLPRPRMRYKG